ncbi:MAG: ABC transporter substrate-binding protein, partial [Bacteroidia bacterium]|nr:ABC transporter substrate-binding protein [Bacteroidia bacterium]
MNKIEHPYSMSALLSAGIMIIMAVVLLSCHGNHKNIDVEEQDSDNQIVKNAKGFSITRSENYSILTVTDPWQGAEGIKLAYYLVRRDSTVPPEIPAEKVIFVPVRSIVCMSTTHVGMINALGESRSITGISTAGYAYSDEITSRVKQGTISEVGYETSLNHELIIKLSPDLVMMYGIGSESSGHVNKLNELGIKIMFNGDYLETDPLAKAEWIKMFGALFCKEELADSIYDKEVIDYNAIRDYVKENTGSKPVVLLGLPFKDTWFISPGNSFVSKLID